MNKRASGILMHISSLMVRPELELSGRQLLTLLIS